MQESHKLQCIKLILSESRGGINNLRRGLKVTLVMSYEKSAGCRVLRAAELGESDPTLKVGKFWSKFKS